MDKIDSNSAALKKYTDQFSSWFLYRLRSYFKNDDNAGKEPFKTILPAEDDESDISVFIRENKLTKEEILVLVLAIVPHLHPSLLDNLIKQTIPDQGDFPQLGGVRGTHFRGFLPTGETALFMLDGNDYAKRLRYQRIFDSDHIFAKKNVLRLDDPLPGEPRFSGKIVISAECIELFTVGKISHPRLSMEFPAQYITTRMVWDDLVLNETAFKQINELLVWVNNHKTLMDDWGMSRTLKPGYRALFHGPPGTGKTLTATLLGKYTGKDVFKIDLSMVVSKFVGETEKNLSNLFNKAENKNWILFFDEADALFSKRTSVRDAHDKYANQEAAYLLQRIESFNGLVILASNFKNNIDDAFLRRFHSIIHFPLPLFPERLKIWQNAFPSNATMAGDIELSLIAKKYELTGSAIMNVVQYCCLQALSKNTGLIDQETLLSGIQKEYLKEGRIW